MSISKIYNAILVYSSYVFSKYSKRLYHSGLPISIAIEPTTSCNLRCPECPSGLRSFSRSTGMLNDELFKNVIDQLYNKLIYLTFYFQGEPYLNPRFLDMVKYASSRGIYTATSTNAHYLSDENARKTVESGLDRIVISIDGTTQEVYEMYRKGGSLVKVIEGTQNIIRWKKLLKSSKPHVIFQFLVVKPNEHQIQEVKALAKSMEIKEILFKTAQIYNYEYGSDLIPTDDKYSRYKQNAQGKWMVKSKLENSCWKMWHSCVITWDGHVVPCCFDKDAKHNLGDVKNSTFDTIWKSAPYNGFRKVLLNSRKEVEMCKNCTEGVKVWG